MSRERSHDYDFGKRKPAAWKHFKQLFGSEVEDLALEFEDIAGGGCVRLLLAVAMHHFTELDTESQLQAYRRYWRWVEARSGRNETLPIPGGLAAIQSASDEGSDGYDPADVRFVVLTNSGSYEAWMIEGDNFRKDDRLCGKWAGVPTPEHPATETLTVIASQHGSIEVKAHIAAKAAEFAGHPELMTRLHPDANGRYHCPHCGRVYQRVSAFRWHLTRTHRDRGAWDYLAAEQYVKAPAA